MDIKKEKYIIVEIIPTTSKKETGFIAQISALKLDGIRLLDRFDYRIEEELIENNDIKKMISYDKELFQYKKEKDSLLKEFINWSENLPLILLDNTYTLNYLEELENQKELIYPYLNLNYQNDSINEMMNKYHLEPSNHLVDLCYEAIIYENNKI